MTINTLRARLVENVPSFGRNVGLNAQAADAVLELDRVMSRMHCHTSGRAGGISYQRYPRMWTMREVNEQSFPNNSERI